MSRAHTHILACSSEGWINTPMAGDHQYTFIFEATTPRWPINGNQDESSKCICTRGGELYKSLGVWVLILSLNSDIFCGFAYKYPMSWRALSF